MVDYQVLAPRVVFNTSDNCSTLSSSQQSTNAGPEKFSIYCGKDLNVGLDSTQNGGNGNPLIITDLVALIAYTFSDCMMACSQYNDKAATWGREERCQSVNYNTHLSDSVSADAANCWLKNGTVAEIPPQGYDCNSCITGLVVT